MTNRNVPKLRFTEFNTLWVKSSLNSISNIKTGFTPSTSNNSYWSGDYPWLSIADMNQGKYILNTSKTITKVATKNKSILKKGTLIMSFKLTIGKLSILEKDMYTNEAICGFNWKDNVNVSTEFMYYLLSSMNIKKYGSQAAKGITLNKDSLKSIPVQLPSIEEQFKIASFLSSVDNKIELLKDKKDKYVEFKHYLLQNLFPRNDELTPKLRFTEEIYYKRQNVSDFLIESEIDVNDNINKRLTIKLNLKGIYKRETKSNEKEGATKQYKRKAGQFIYGKQNLFKGAFGIIPPELDGFLSSKDLPSFDFKDNINSKWFYYYFSRSNFYKHLENLSNGTGSKRISPEEFLKIQINVPQSIEEQEKIASFLSFVDKKIDLLDQEIEYVEEYKKGLIQKMFI